MISRGNDCSHNSNHAVLRQWWREPEHSTFYGETIQISFTVSTQELKKLRLYWQHVSRTHLLCSDGPNQNVTLLPASAIPASHTPGFSPLSTISALFIPLWYISTVLPLYCSQFCVRFSFTLKNTKKMSQERQYKFMEVALQCQIKNTVSRWNITVSE